MRRRRSTILEKVMEVPGIDSIDLTRFIQEETPLKMNDHPSTITNIITRTMVGEIKVKKNGKRSQFFPELI